MFPTIGTQSVGIFDYDNDGWLDVTHSAGGTGTLGLIRGPAGREVVFDREFVFADTRRRDEPLLGTRNGRDRSRDLMLEGEGVIMPLA